MGIASIDHKHMALSKSMKAILMKKCNGTTRNESVKRWFPFGIRNSEQSLRLQANGRSTVLLYALSL